MPTDPKRSRLISALICGIGRIDVHGERMLFARQPIEQHPLVVESCDRKDGSEGLFVVEHGRAVGIEDRQRHENGE